MFETLFTTEEELKLQKQAQKEFELISFREQNAISQIYEVFYTKEEQLRIQNKQTQKESLLVFSYVGKSTVILGSAYLFWNIINSGIEQSFNSISV
jgi:predicted nucleotide-binding protein (sugar kinase/HSP70/actin superfamily)